jgi:hypothetical protein
MGKSLGTVEGHGIPPQPDKPVHRIARFRHFAHGLANHLENITENHSPINTSPWQQKGTRRCLFIPSRIN